MHICLHIAPHGGICSFHLERTHHNVILQVFKTDISRFLIVKNGICVLDSSLLGAKWNCFQSILWPTLRCCSRHDSNPQHLWCFCSNFASAYDRWQQSVGTSKPSIPCYGTTERGTNWSCWGRSITLQQHLRIRFLNNCQWLLGICNFWMPDCSSYLAAIVSSEL